MQFVPTNAQRPRKPTREVAEAAAKWWRQQIDGSKPAGRDNGAPVESSLMAIVMITESVTVPRADAAKYDAFEKDLAKHIANNFDHHSGLSCDYGPSHVLSAIASRHDISDRAFPWKTHMHVYETYALASLGYGANYVCVAGVQPWEGQFFDDGDRIAGVEYISAGAQSTDGKTWRLSASTTDDAWDFVGEEAARAAFDVLVDVLKQPEFRRRPEEDLRGDSYWQWRKDRQNKFTLALEQAAAK
jgi:hypothetical protein